jgi:putative ABC transport system permease protein
MAKLGFKMDSLIQLNFFLKELGKNKSKIAKVFFSIFISLLIFSSVIILKNNIETEIKKNSRVLLGGDLELSTKNKALQSDHLDKLKKHFLMTEVIEFTSIIKTSKKESQTTRIKVIDNFYPLVGDVNIEPRGSLNILREKPNTILIDKDTKKNLDLKLGDKIKIQNISFNIVGVINSLPDIPGFFLFGNQALVSKSSYQKLETKNLGSFINFKYKMISKSINKKMISNIISDESISIKYPKDISKNLKKTIENFIYFLSIISASAILISGIGLKNSLFSFLSSNQLKISILKSLGLSSKNIKILYYSQSLIVLVICSIISYILSLIIISFLDNNILSFLNIELDVKFNFYELFLIQFFSIIIFFIFAKPVLDSIDSINVTDLFRNSSTQLNFSYSRKSIIEVSVLTLIFIFLFCILNVKPKETSVFFCFFIIVITFYYFLSKFYILFLRKFKRIQNVFLKMSIKNLHSFRSLNSIVIMTMGVGLTVLYFLGIFSSNINKELNGSIPKNAPNYFFLGIQKGDLDLYTKQIYKIDNEAKQITVPMISARVERINNRKPKEIIDDKNKSYWFVNGERRISWLKDPPPNNPIVKGKWWNSDEIETLMLSIDQRVANDLKLSIGDSITFNIYGSSVTGIITNFRKVDYKDLNINFAILFNPKFALQIPHEFLSTVRFKNEELISLNNLLQKLPNITYIKVSEYLDKTKKFLNKLFISSILISSVIILIGLIVISNAVSVIGKLKVYQNLVLRILGYQKSNIYKMIIFESLILSIPIILSSLIFAVIFSYIFITNFLGINWYFSFWIPLIISILFIVVLLLTLLTSNRKYLNFNTYLLLRNG